MIMEIRNSGANVSTETEMATENQGEPNLLFAAWLLGSPNFD
jgi:hypothetical protein